MSQTFKISVNNTFNFDINQEDVSNLDAIQISDSEFHILQQNKSYKSEIVDADLNTKSYNVKVNNNTYNVNIFNNLDLLIKDMGFEIGSTKHVNSIKAPMPGLILDIAIEVNEILLKLLPDDMFCAASIIELHNNGKSLSVWAGGTPDMYLVNDRNGQLMTIHSQHMALGILDNQEFDSDLLNFSVHKHQRLIMFTDGVVEITDENEQMFGYERLTNLLTSPDYRELPLIIEELYDFSAGVEQDDDISILSLRCAEVNSSLEQIENSYSNLPHHFNLVLNANSIKTSDPVLEVIDMITHIKGAEEHRSTLFLILSEAYNNALEHGLLDLSSSIKDSEDGFVDYYLQRDYKLNELNSGSITIDVKYIPQETMLYLTITDSGKGFDVTRETSDLDNYEKHGRGFLILNELAASVQYNDKGNQMKIGYQLNVSD